MRKFVLFPVLLAAFSMLSAQNMNRCITLGLKMVNEYFTVVVSAQYANTKVRLVNNTLDTVFSIDTSDTRIRLEARPSQAVKYKIYGDIVKFVCVNDFTAVSSMDVSGNNALRHLECRGNRFKTLDVGSNTALEYLDCSNNYLTGLDVSKNTRLVTLYCDLNEITSLNLAYCTMLERLNCDKNKLSDLYLARNTRLVYLDCSRNSLTTLDVGKNTRLETLYCMKNNLTALDISANTALKTLSFDDNKLTALDLGKCTGLVVLSCKNNRIATLDVSRNRALERMYCTNNSLASLDVSNNPKLRILYCDGNSFSTEAWDALICSLPEKKAADSAIFIPLLNDTDAGHAGFVAADAKNAVAKHWKVRYSYINKIITTTGSHLCGLNMDSRIILHVKKGARIGFYCSAFTDGTNIRVTSGTHDTIFSRGKNYEEMVWFTAGADTMTIYGDVKQLNCSKNGTNLTGVDASNNTSMTFLYASDNSLTMLDVSKNTALWSLGCQRNSLTELDVRNCPALAELRCQSNRLSDLDVSRNSKLVRLACFGNAFTTEVYDRIMCALPNPAQKSILWPLNDSTDANYSLFMATNSNNAREKGWNILYADSGREVPATHGNFDCAMVPVREAVEASAFRVWPNPARTELHIAGAEGMLSVCDLTGRVVWRVGQPVGDEIVVNVADWAKGMYFVRSGSHISKFIKE